MNKRNPILYIKKDECCGCGACATICPKEAINFEYDNEGFLYPKIDSDKCIGCLNCEKVCAFKKDTLHPIKEIENTKVFAAKSKNENVILNSSSGGMFTVFSDYFIENGDAIAAFKYSYESNCVKLSIISDKKSRDEARGSKYIQAELNKSFDDIVSYLLMNSEKKLMVFGTGCQIAGLDLLLKEKKLRNRVVLVDLICHGAASPGLWKKYIKIVEENEKGKVSFITFKNKRNGWESPSTYVLINNKEVLIKPYSDWFYMGWSLRKSCYSCPYTRIDRHSDITIGDYWGIEKVNPQFYNPMGVSLVIIHNSVGMNLFNSIKNNLHYYVSNREECLQPRLISPQSYPKDRDKFWDDMENMGMNYCCEHYFEDHKLSLKKKMLCFLQSFLGDFFKN